MGAVAETKEVAGVGLYERLVGAGWETLDEAVRRFHPSGKGVRAAGTFAVRRGRGPFARLLARLMNLPESGEAVPLLLRVTPHAGGERWRRSFAGRDFVTEQRAHAGRRTAGRAGPLPAERAGPLLAERAGPVEMLFRLKAEGGVLVYAQEGVALCAGSLRVPLPRRLAPRVEASERAGRGGRGVHVSVRVAAPLVGLVIRYEGLVTTEGGAG
ncbi:MAG TPA: DUF4166 domain-containing protein [Pyrinomonadaceae bacterium]|nr:DUF4166 domain-containing protein [Pyrinomonadaceae bacterium]